MSTDTKDPRNLYPQPTYLGKEQTSPDNEEEMAPKVEEYARETEGLVTEAGRKTIRFPATSANLP